MSNDDRVSTIKAVAEAYKVSPLELWQNYQAKLDREFAQDLRELARTM